MMWGFYDSWSWLWMGGMMLLFWGAVFAIVIWAAGSLAGPRQTSDRALETLRSRLAAGDISQEDFERTKRALRG
jgi:uncharacterized membrane protein